MGQGKSWTEAQRASRIEHLLNRNRQQHKGEFLYEDPEWMREAYIDRDLSLRRVAAEAGCGLRTIARWMQIHGIPTDPTKMQRRHRTQFGADWHTWRGDEIRYAQAHNRVYAARGRATEHACEHCGKRAQQWAYDHTDPNERRDEPGSSPFSTDVNKYIPLCKSCHRRFDLKAALDADDMAGEAAAS